MEQTFDKGLTAMLAMMGLLIGSFLLVYYLKYAKGRLHIQVEKMTIMEGETINGMVDMTIKKNIDCHGLEVSLVGVEITRQYHHSHGNHRTRSKEVYRDSQIIQQRTQLPAGHHDSIAFQLMAPDFSEQRRVKSGVLGLLQKALRHNKLISWKLEARLRTKGVDLLQSQRIMVSRKPIHHV